MRASPERSDHDSTESGVSPGAGSRFTDFAGLLDIQDGLSTAAVSPVDRYRSPEPTRRRRRRSQSRSIDSLGRSPHLRGKHLRRSGERKPDSPKAISETLLSRGSSLIRNAMSPDGDQNPNKPAANMPNVNEEVDAKMARLRNSFPEGVPMPAGMHIVGRKRGRKFSDAPKVCAICGELSNAADPVQELKRQMQGSEDLPVLNMRWYMLWDSLATSARFVKASSLCLNIACVLLV